jgi:hypothetical protein
MLKLPRMSSENGVIAPILIVAAVLVLAGGALSFQQYQKNNASKNEQSQLSQELETTKAKEASVAAELQKLQNEDQVKKNKELQDKIAQIESTYKSTIASYEKLQDLKNNNKYPDLDKLLAKSLNELAAQNYSGADTDLKDLSKKITDEQNKIAAAKPQSAPAAPATASNTPPGSGFARQSVHTEAGDFNVDIISADLNSTKVIADTASDGDCGDNCPTMPLAAFASRNGAIAGINGPYFCPASYPTCAGKTNSFDTLLLGKNKHYFNSDNNVYSNVPAIIFSGSSVRVVGRSLEWGRDTSPDSVIANYPLLTQGGNAVSYQTGDVKLTAKGPEKFLGTQGFDRLYGLCRKCYCV